MDLYDIWNSKKLLNFRINMINNGIKNIDICSKCNFVYAFNNEYDNLDKYKEYLLKIYKK